MKQLLLLALFKLLQLPLAMGVLLFLPAGTFDYWEAWFFLTLFFACCFFITVYLAVTDPKLLERRMHVGPFAEKEKTQKAIMVLAIVCFAAMIALPGFDRRFGWSKVPNFIVILGDIFILIGFFAVTWVMRENTFAASTIHISKGHRVVATGPYSMVRHPMYAGALFLLLGIPLALGSWWDLLTFIPSTAGIVWRLLDEERFLRKNLRGYTEYIKKVRYRLIPFIW